MDASEDDMLRDYEDLEKGSETIQIEDEQRWDQEEEYITSKVY